jgi:DNA-binding response OmpR family regulator
MTDTAHILVVDDEADIRASLEEYLTLHGLSVAVAEGGEAMRARVAERAPDLVVLDLRMPGEDGLTLSRWLRANTRCGILMLTAIADPVDRVVGLEMGADDYMAKPFHPRELLARIRTVLRRVGEAAPAAEAPASRVRLGRCWLDLETSSLVADDGTEEPLTATEFDLLKAFAANPNRVLTRDDLLSLAGSRTTDPFDRSIDIRINRIRRKVEVDPGNPKVIRTVRGSGYVFEPGKPGPGS